VGEGRSRTHRAPVKSRRRRIMEFPWASVTSPRSFPAECLLGLQSRLRRLRVPARGTARNGSPVLTASLPRSAGSPPQAPCYHGYATVGQSGDLRTQGDDVRNDLLGAANLTSRHDTWSGVEGARVALVKALFA